MKCANPSHEEAEAVVIWGGFSLCRECLQNAEQIPRSLRHAPLIDLLICLEDVPDDTASPAAFHIAAQWLEATDADDAITLASVARITRDARRDTVSA